MLAKKTSKNQLTLPKEIVKEFPEIDYFDVHISGRKIVLTPVKINPLDAPLSSVRDKMNKLGINETDVARAVTWARKRK